MRLSVTMIPVPISAADAAALQDGYEEGSAGAGDSEFQVTKGAAYAAVVTVDGKEQRRHIKAREWKKRKCEWVVAIMKEGWCPPGTGKETAYRVVRMTKNELHEAIELAKDTGNSSDVNLDESSGSETELEASVRHLTGVQLHPPAAKRLRTITPSGGGSGMNLDESDSDSDSGKFLLHRQSPTASTWQQHQAVHDSSSDDSESADLQLEAEDSGMSDVFGNSSSGDDDGND